MKLIYPMRNALEKILKPLLPEGVPPLIAEASRKEFGHYTCTAAMRIAKEQGRNPLDVAREIARQLEQNAPKGMLSKAEAVAPGFVNIWISQAMFAKNTASILAKKSAYGKTSSGAKKQKLQLEFISANPTGPLTMANGRGGFWGDVLGRVLRSTGRKVEREYYINDAGNQIRSLGLSVLAAAGKVPDEENYYHGEHISEWATRNTSALEKGVKDPEALGRKVAKDFLSKLIKPVIAKEMGVKFDRFTSEYADIRKKGWPEKALALFRKEGFLYEAEGATWLATTKFGDDKDRVLITRDGHPTYFLIDAAHYLETAKRKLAKLIILGADHHGYVPRIQAAAKIAGVKESQVLIVQLIRLIKDGQEFRMSKRKGNFVTMKDLLEEVGPDSARFFFLMVTPEKAMDFDIGLAKEKSLKNPVFYVQYAYVRSGSVLEKAKAAKIKPAVSKLDLLTSPEDMHLMATLARMEEVVEDTARDYQTSRLTRYALDIATAFHAFYEKERIVGEQGGVASQRATLVAATRQVLSNVFSLIGISSPKKM